MNNLIYELENIKKWLPPYPKGLDSTIKEKIRIIEKNKTNPKINFCFKLIFTSSLTLVLVTITTILCILYMNNKKPLMSIRITNLDVNDVMPNPILFYGINIPQNEYGYGEEIIINFKMARNSDYNNFIKEGSVTIKIVAEDFDIIGESMFTYEQFELDKYCYDYRKKGTKEEWIIDNNFILKTNKETGTTNSIKILVEFDADEELKTTDKYNFNEDGFVEYSIYHVNDQFGILLDVGMPQNEGKLFCKSLNRQFKKGLIDKKEYMKKLRIYQIDGEIKIFSGGTSSFGIDGIIHYEYRFTYFSEEISAKFVLNEEYTYLNDLYLSNDEESLKEVAKFFIKILYDDGLINDELYNNELLAINERQVSKKHYMYIDLDEVVCFSDYEKYLYYFNYNKQ